MEPLETRGLDDRDAAFAHAMYDATVRRWLTVEWVCDRFSRRPLTELEPGVQAALLVGGAQILAMAGVPTHAAIDEAVEWAKHAVRPGAAGLVNAVLRKVAAEVGEPIDGDWNLHRDELPDGGCRPLATLTLPEKVSDRIAASFGLPGWFLSRVVEHSGVEAGVELATASLDKPPAILDVSALPALPEACEAHEEPGYAVWTGPRGGLARLLTDEVWVQDPSSGAAVRSVADLKPRRVLDLCAGLGTKTRQIARAFPDAEVWATDTDAVRSETLRGVWQRHERVRVLDYGEALEAADGWADLVVLDVPCTNSGVLGRRVEARHRLTRAALTRLVAIQREILSAGAQCLSEEGAILYATCSVDPEENGLNALWAADEFALLPVRERSDRPRGSGRASRDGSYSVLLTGPGRLGWT